MKIKSLFYGFWAFAVLLSSCKKENVVSEAASNPVAKSIGFSARVFRSGSANKNWRTTSASSNQATPIGGVDYFANRGGINPDELTLMSFGKFTDDTSSNIGRLTIFIESVTDTGTFSIDGTNANNAVLSISNGNNLEHYASDIDNQGAVVITKYDAINKVVSGTFSFQLVASGNVIAVEDGVFTDVPFKQ